MSLTLPELGTGWTYYPVTTREIPQLRGREIESPRHQAGKDLFARGREYSGSATEPQKGAARRDAAPLSRERRVLRELL